MTSSDVHLFLEKLMNIKILNMGGASASIFGSSGAENDTLNSLRKSAITFAVEYSKQSPDVNALLEYSQEIEGHLQVLKLTNTVSEDTADKLINELHALTEKMSA